VGIHLQTLPRPVTQAHHKLTGREIASIELMTSEHCCGTCFVLMAVFLNNLIAYKSQPVSKIEFHVQCTA
jgi:hypothetical protein